MIVVSMEPEGTVLFAIMKVLRKNAIAAAAMMISVSHAIGTTKAMEMGEIEGAMSSLAIAVSGLCTVLFASVFANFI